MTRTATIGEFLAAVSLFVPAVAQTPLGTVLEAKAAALSTAGKFHEAGNVYTSVPRSQNDQACADCPESGDDRGPGYQCAGRRGHQCHGSVTAIQFSLPWIKIPATEEKSPSGDYRF